MLVIPYALRKEESPGWIFAHHLQGTYSGCSVMPATYSHSSWVLEQVVGSKICSRPRATPATQKQLHSTGRVESNARLALKLPSKPRWWVWREYLGNLQRECHSSRGQAIRSSLPSEKRDTSCPVFETAAAIEDQKTDISIRWSSFQWAAERGFLRAPTSRSATCMCRELRMSHLLKPRKALFHNTSTKLGAKVPWASE